MLESALELSHASSGLLMASATAVELLLSVVEAGFRSLNVVPRLLGLLLGTLERSPFSLLFALGGF